MLGVECRTRLTQSDLLLGNAQVGTAAQVWGLNHLQFNSFFPTGFRMSILFLLLALNIALGLSIEL